MLAPNAPGCAGADFRGWLPPHADGRRRAGHNPVPDKAARHVAGLLGWLYEWVVNRVPGLAWLRVLWVVELLKAGYIKLTPAEIIVFESFFGR